MREVSGLGNGDNREMGVWAALVAGGDLPGNATGMWPFERRNRAKKEPRRPASRGGGSAIEQIN